MNKQSVRNLYCSVCGNIVPCTKTKKRTVDAYCIYCGKKQKLIDRKSMEPKNQGEFEMPRNNFGNYNNSNNRNGNYRNNSRNDNNKDKNHNNKNYNRGGYKRYEDE